MSMNQKKESGVAAVDRALSILDAFSAGDTSLTLHQLAERTNLYKSTILRLVASLERNGCMARLEDGRYQLGAVLVRWSNLYLTSIRVETHVVPVLDRLATETGESATYYTRQGDARMCLARVDCTRSVRDHVKVGDILPLDRGAGGKVLVAFGPQRPSKKAPPPQPMVIVTLRERDSEAAGMAAPVFGSGANLLGAISLSGPATRFGKASLPRLARALLGGASELTLRFGGDSTALREAVANPFTARRKPAVAAA